MTTRAPNLDGEIARAPAVRLAETRPSMQVRRTRAPAIPDLRRLHAFIVLAEELHFRRAADRLAMAQSPLSRMIKSLEHDVGALLLARTRRSVRLTSAGVSFLNDAHELLRLTEWAVHRARFIDRADV